MLKVVNENCCDLMEIFNGLAQVTRCSSQDAAFTEGVTFHQFMIMDVVAQKKTLHMADIHKILSVEKSTTSCHIKPLIQKGLLRREKATHDSRAVTLVLAEEGVKVHKKIRLCLMDFFRKVTRNIPASKKNEVLATVRSFISARRNASGNGSCCK
jgi:DNA-binding MarR family transcriptional regulator